MRNNSEITIHRAGRYVSVPITPSSKRRWKLMEEDCIELAFNLASSVAFDIGDYVDDEVFGRFTISEKPAPADYDPSSGAYKYSLRFDADWVNWKNHLFMLTSGAGTQVATDGDDIIVSVLDDSAERRETEWVLTDILENHLRVFIDNLTEIGYTGYSARIHTDTVEDAKRAVSVTYSGTSLFDALKTLSEAYGCEFWVEDKVIHFGKCEVGNAIPFSMTDDNREINVENMTPIRNDAEYGNRFYVYGSTKNIPETYRKRLVFEASQITTRQGAVAFRDKERIIEPSMLTRRTVTVPLTSRPYSGGWIVEKNEYIAYEDEDQYGQRVEMEYYSVQKKTQIIPTTDGGTMLTINPGNNDSRWNVTWYIYTSDGALLATGKKYLQFPIRRADVTGVFVRYSYQADWARTEPHTEPDDPVITIVESKEAAYFATLSFDDPVYGERYTAEVRLIEDNYFVFVRNEPGDYYPTCPLPNFSQGSKYTLNFSVNGSDGLRYAYVPYSFYTDDDTDYVRMVGERRLMLPEGTEYIQLDPGLTRDQIVEKVVIFEEIYPKCALRITSVEVGEYYASTTHSDGSKTAESMPAYTIQAKRIDGASDVDFPFDPTTMRSVGKLTVTFLTPDETKAYSGKAEENICDLMGMTFEVACNRSNNVTTYQIARNEDYGDKLPNTSLLPKVGDAFILAGWNPAAMGELNLIEGQNGAEAKLLAAGTTYAQLAKDTYNFECAMMSDWIVEHFSTIQAGDLPCKKLLPFGQKVSIHHAALSSDMETRIIGAEYKLDIPYDTPIYTAGETEAYSRFKAIEKKLKAQAQSVSAASGTQSASVVPQPGQGNASWGGESYYTASLNVGGVEKDLMKSSILPEMVLLGDVIGTVEE